MNAKPLSDRELEILSGYVNGTVPRPSRRVVGRLIDELRLLRSRGSRKGGHVWAAFYVEDVSALLGIIEAGAEQSETVPVERNHRGEDGGMLDTKGLIMDLLCGATDDCLEALPSGKLRKPSVRLDDGYWPDGARESIVRALIKIEAGLTWFARWDATGVPENPAADKVTEIRHALGGRGFLGW